MREKDKHFFFNYNFCIEYNHTYLYYYIIREIQRKT